ncbi:hypothetical protein MMC14_006003 [Varicellaria rhodocarpa]|nr:hypothetical protein [Varicellaria rhodocarpa]
MASKRRLEEEGITRFITTPVTAFTADQLNILRNIEENLPPGLECLLPLLIDKTELSTQLVVVEAKPKEHASAGLPQLIIYQAAFQRQRAHKANKTIFGILSGGVEFRFTCLSNEADLYVSRPLSWRDDRSEILQSIDTIFQDAIASSPHTTPVNTTVRGFNHHLLNSWKFGGKLDLGEEEGEVDAIRGRDGIITLRERFEIL